MKNDFSIFRKYYQEQPFIDRYEKEKNDAVDVIIPVIHTNELWEENLKSIYREVPVNRLLISDGGCIDNSIDMVKKFPRVVIYDHRKFVSLGYCIRKLIEDVETDWFIYPHSDVYLPDGWFDIMKKYKDKYDWYGCPMQHTVMVEYNNDYGERPWAGAQMGRKKAFEQGIEKIDDDYVYRQEDFVWRKILQENDFKEGFVDETFHYHQTMHKPSPSARQVKEVQIKVQMSREEEIKTCISMAKGIVKYLKPPELVLALIQNIDRMEELDCLTREDFYKWVKETNSTWLPYIPRYRYMSFWKKLFRAIIRRIKI